MSTNKYLIIIQANQQDMGKAMHGLLYGQDLHEAGMEVEVYFDGAGTQWPNEFSKPDHIINPLYKQVMKTGILKGGCGACAGFFDVEEEVQQAGLKLVGSETNSGHLNFSQFMKDGFVPIIL
ncbi:hypothetical protein EHS13_21810 [Paenibacillus psychroresistens]|uniref:DsrE family protein n=1 Tax=Paenibacillus psychroresistens TaxID=1778678 RepID=A0A6B8RNI3_9BACL|nr:hypothetical protein [Paenibacillus psychroresistens]QGQ97334.1 hypothetical protein EHS13_21810 [Paenibacillus psychroresistens]